MLAIQIVTAWAAYNLPESKGRDLGHTSLEDAKVDGEEETEGSEMAFRYGDDATKPATSSTGIV